MDTNKYLIIGGSTKCGTTSVFNYFEFHPQVCPCDMKESRFFWTDAYPLSAAPRGHSDVRRFSDLFNHCKPDRIRMEATPDYLYSNETAISIHQQLPGSKMLFIVREPVSRLISWYNFAILNNLLPKQTTFNDYVNLQKEQTSEKTTPQHLRALEQGKYAYYLKHFIQLFGPDRVQIVFYEDMVSDPENFCRSISRFIQIDEHFFNGFEFKIFNKTVHAKSTTAHSLFRKMKRTIRPVTKIFHPSIRKNIKLAGYHVESAYQYANKGDIRIPLRPDQETLQFLNDYYADDKLQLQKITRTHVPW